MAVNTLADHIYLKYGHPKGPYIGRSRRSGVRVSVKFWCHPWTSSLDWRAWQRGRAECSGRPKVSEASLFVIGDKDVVLGERLISYQSGICCSVTYCFDVSVYDRMWFEVVHVFQACHCFAYLREGISVVSRKHHILSCDGLQDPVYLLGGAVSRTEKDLRSCSTA